MSALRHLSAFISERLTAAAAEIVGAVEKTLAEHQGEIRRSKQEIDHLRTLVLWPQVRLRRSAPPCCDKEASLQCCQEEDWAPDVSPLHIKEEHDQPGPACRHQCGQEEPPSHLCRALTVEQAAGIKAEPDGGEFIASPSPTREAEIPRGINPESSGPRRETLIEPLEITHHEQDEPGEQRYSEQDWSPCRDREDPDRHQIKVEKFTSASPQEESDHGYELALESGRSDYDEPRSSSPSHDQTLYTAGGKRRGAEAAGCHLSGPTGASQTFYSVNQSEYGENTEVAVNGEWTKARTPTGQKKRPNSNLCSEGREGFGAEGDVNDLTRERRHTCPMCAKRFKESSHLKDHVRIHTGEKPYRCKECGMHFRQSGALTLHLRIHTGERPYQCADCGRRFNRKGDMETHRVTHTGERPHLCRVCGKSFKRKSNLNTHLKIHTEDKMDYTQPL